MSERGTDLTHPRGVADRLHEVRVVDVREPFEWNAGRIEGSMLVPLNRLMAGQAEGVEPDRPVVLVCRSGSRSEVAALLLRARGYEAHNLEGGLEAWQAEGLPLTTPEGAPGTVA
jgi:rhodanese-related sulfurtransferase